MEILETKGRKMNKIKREEKENLHTFSDTTKWNQQPYYNTYCPRGTPVGCVATATSQIMRLYKYLKRGTGSHSYSSSYGTLSFNYDYNIDWDAMPESVLRQRNDEVARFCYGVAVALDMSFSTSGSGTWQQYVPAALKKYYKPELGIRNVCKKLVISLYFCNFIVEYQ